MNLSPEQKMIAWQAGVLHWKLRPEQKLIYKMIKRLPADQRETLTLCARGFGKSFLEVILAFEDCLQNPNVEVCIIGPSQKQAKSIVSPIIRLILQDAPQGLVTQKKSTVTWEFSNGSSLHVAGFDTALEASRGRTFFNVYSEELGFSKTDLDQYRYILYSVLMPTLRSRVGAKLMHFTTPARIVDHPLHIETMPKCKLKDAVYRFTIEDNSSLTPEQIELEIESQGGRENIDVKRELFCLIERDDSIVVVNTFDETRHVAKLCRSPHYKYLVSGDLGYKSDKTAFHLLAYDHDIGKVLVLEEIWLEARTATKEIADLLKSKWGELNPTHVVDYQGNAWKDFSVEGITLGFPSDKQNFHTNVRNVRNIFYKDLVLIDESCSVLVQTCRSQIFNSQKTDFLRTTALGHADALMSALVYGMSAVDRTTDLRPKPHRSTHHIAPRPKHQLTKLSYQR